MGSYWLFFNRVLIMADLRFQYVLLYSVSYLLVMLKICLAHCCVGRDLQRTHVAATLQHMTAIQTSNGRIKYLPIRIVKI